MVLLILAVSAACDSSDDDSKADPVSGGAQVSSDARADAEATEAAAPNGAAVLDLADVKSNPDDYEWFDFRPNVKKLILAGAAETEHVAILWYTTKDGGVALHYHSKTESVYVVDGHQTDGKGDYPTGTVYFNPPGSGHEVSNSTGFFLLAYAAPPDFASTDKIEEYTRVRIDTTAPDFTSLHPFAEKETGVSVFTPSLDETGGLSAQFIEIAASKESYAYEGNYLLVLKGSCVIDDVTYGEQKLVVGEDVAPQSYRVAAPKDGSCLALGVSF